MFCRNKQGKNYPFMEIPETIFPIRDEKQLSCIVKLKKKKKSKVNQNAQKDHNKCFCWNQ